MPEIRPSSDLGNKYNKISEFCHKTYEKLVGKFELYDLLDEGMEAVKENKVKPFHDVISNPQMDKLHYQ